MVGVVLVMLDQVFLSWHGVLVLVGRIPVKQRVLNFTMSEWMTDDEDYRQEGSGDGVESEIEMEFNKFIELSWVSTEIIMSSK